jgi:ribonuclease-3
MASTSPQDVTRTVVERLVDQPVKDLPLYRRALTHCSLLRGEPDQHLQSNERLEFLGDALIDLIVSEVLYDRFPEEDEGHLTRLRAKLVSGPALAQYARRMDLGPHLLMSDNAEQGEGRDNSNILADAFEALTGALYLDQDYAAAAQFVHDRALDPFDLEDVAARDDNYKSQLLEWMQAEGRPQPTYRVVHEEGPSHDKTFTVEAVVGDTAYAQGTAGSKQQAEQEAARRTLEDIQAAESAH